MIKYKDKHSHMYRKIVVDQEFKSLDQLVKQKGFETKDFDVMNIKVRNNMYSKRTTLKQVMDSLNNPVANKK